MNKFQTLVIPLVHFMSKVLVGINKVQPGLTQDLNLTHQEFSRKNKRTWKYSNQIC